MVGYRTHAEPSIIRRSAELWPEGVEEMALAASFTSPYPFPGLPSLAGGAADGTDLEALPNEHNLSFVRGDAFTMSFMFVGVNWTPSNPGGSPTVPWEQHWWASEIRDPTHAPADPCRYYNGWIPIWGGLPPNEYKTWFQMTKVGEFTCDSVYVPGTPGTLVTISLASDETILFPSDKYHWDLQSATERTDNPNGTVTLGGVRTWVQGAVTIAADYTITPEKV